jgi:hypothetical protein
VAELLEGAWPVTEHLVRNDAKQLAALQRFSELMMGVQARPKTHVAYSREAWVSLADNSVRVTIDRDVRSQPEPTLRLSTEINGAISVFGSQAILEIKYTGRFPNWFKELVRVFDLQRCSAPKYAEGVTLMGEQQLQPARVGTKLLLATTRSKPVADRYPSLLEEPI